VAICEKQFGTQNGMRIEPVGVLIAGASGAGKSSTTLPILLSAIARTLDPKLQERLLTNYSDFIFYRNNENEFWDGYRRSHHVVVYDDYGQKRDTPGGVNLDAFEIVRLINTASFHLRMSAVEDKSNHYAAPRLVFATTNRLKLDFVGVTQPKAVVRRFHLAYLQVPKMKYTMPGALNISDRQLDVEKLRRDFPLDFKNPDTLVDLSVAEFHEWDFLTGKPADSGAVLSYEQVIDKIVYEYELRDNMAGMKHEFLQNIMKKNFTLKEEIGVGLPDASRKYLSPVFTAGHRAKVEIELALDEILTKFRKPSFTISPERRRFLLALAGGFVFGATALTLATTMIRAFPNHVAESYQEPNRTARQTRAANSRPKGKLASVQKTVMRDQREAIKQAFLRAEAGQSLSKFNSILKLNTYLLEMDNITLGFCLFITGTSFVIPLHFKFKIDSYTEYNDDEELMPLWLSFRDPFTGNLVVSLNWHEMVATDEQSTDHVFLRVDSKLIRQHGNLIDCFQDASKYVAGYQFDCAMPVRRDQRLVVLMPSVKIGADWSYGQSQDSLKSSKLQYRTATTLGDCGSFLLTTCTRFNRPTILGIHTAGEENRSDGNKVCAGVLLDKDLVVSSLQALGEIPFDEEEISISPEANMEGFNALGYLPQKSTVMRSKILKSPLSGNLWPITHGTARLRPFTDFEGKEIDPAALARAKYSHEEVPVDTKLLDEIHPFICKLVRTRTENPPWDPRLFSFDEAVDGIDGQNFCGRMERKTSAGYPFNQNPNANGKRYWLGDGDRIDKSNPNTVLLEDRVNEIIECAKANKRLTHVYIDCLKDEHRPLEKVRAGKTRQFMASPMDYSIAMKMYFGDFIRSVYENHTYNGINIGIDHHTEWGCLYNYLKAFKEYETTAGDYSAFDGHLLVPIMYRVLDIVEAFYIGCPKEDTRVRYVLFQDIINSRHLSEGTLYAFNGANSSGNILTSVLNSIVNIFMIYGAARTAQISNTIDMTTDELPTVKDLFTYSRVATFGDDNIITYDSGLSHVFGQQVLTYQLGKLFNIKYTNEMKTDEKVTGRALEEVSFLKRTFKFHGGHVRAPLELDVIKEQLNWARKGSSHDELCLRVDACLVELAQHGQETYDEHAHVILKAAMENLNHASGFTLYKHALDGDIVLNSFC
jgi:hypothetical protein